MKETSIKYCAECQRDFKVGEIVNFTWYENRCFCNECKKIMNKRVTPSYLDWQLRKVTNN